MLPEVIAPPGAQSSGGSRYERAGLGWRCCGRGNDGLRLRICTIEQDELTLSVPGRRGRKLLREANAMQHRWGALLAAALLLAAACGGGDDEAEEPRVGTASDPFRISVAATEYDFKIEDRIPAGHTRFVMTNVGDRKHEMGLFQLKRDVRLNKNVVAGERLQSFVQRDLGHIRPVAPKATGTLTVNLTPGTYGIVCHLRAPDGKSHASHGMFAQFNVARFKAVE